MWVPAVQSFPHTDLSEQPNCKLHETSVLSDTQSSLELWSKGIREEGSKSSDKGWKETVGKKKCSYSPKNILEKSLLMIPEYSFLS